MSTVDARNAGKKDHIADRWDAQQMAKATRGISASGKRYDQF